MSKFLRAFLAAGCSTIILLVFVEALVLWVSHLSHLDPLLLPDPTLGWRLIPNLKAARKPYLVYTDGNGFRVSRNERNRNQEQYDVVFLGDSFCFGSGLDYSKTLVGRFAQTHPRLRVANMGVPAYGSDQEYLMLRRHLALVREGGVVVVLTFVNDFDDIRDRWDDARLKPWFALEGGKLVLHRPHSLLNSLCWYSRTAYVVAHFTIAAGAIAPKIRGHDAYADRLYGALITRIAELVAQRHGQLVIAYTSGREADSGAALQRAESAGGWAERAGAAFIDLDEMPDAANPRLYIKGDIHWDEAGALLNYNYFAGRFVSAMNGAKVITWRDKPAAPSPAIGSH
jgi:hypothetical protein